LLDNANLKTIEDMRDAFKVEVGFSDHTLGILAPVVATTLGAKVIEKHFILDKSIGGADAKFSLDKIEFENMIKAVRDTEKLLGKVDYSINQEKQKNRQFARSLYISKDIKKGEVLNEENLTVKRPGNGISPMKWDEIVGSKAQRDYTEDEMI